MSMRPTFMGFETATRGLMASQKAIDVVNNNTTNIGVTGYTRQRADMVSLSINGRYTRYKNNPTAFSGQGANVYGVSQIRDPFLDRRFREECSDVGYYDSTSAIMDDLTNALDEIVPSNISTALLDFETAWAAMQTPGNDLTNSANIRAVATQIVSIFQQMSTKLDNVWNQHQGDLVSTVDDVNKILEEIAGLNTAIYNSEFNTLDTSTKAWELRDQRNVLLDSLSMYADITYSEGEDGQVTVFMGGHKAVDGDKAEKLMISTDRGDARYPTVNVFWNDTGAGATFMSGSIIGSVHMLNGRGVNATGGSNESVEEGILYYKQKVDDFARTLAQAFNNSIENDNPPGGFKQLFQFVPDDATNASGIQVSTQWANDSAYIYTDIKEKIVEGSDSNTFAAKVSQLFTDKLDFGEFKGSFTEYITFYSVSKLGNNKSYSDSRLDSVTDVADNILDSIQQVSGVSLDEEGIDSMMYQKAYNAVSRVFTTLDEMLDTLINSTGTVGR